MTKTTHLTLPNEKTEAKRWLVIGAYQAGANDKKIARLCGLNQSAVRRIILNFKKTGSPSIPRGLSARDKSKPFIEYDEQGHIIDSEEEEEEVQQSELSKKIRARRPSAKDLIAYVLNKAQQKQTTFVKQEEEEIVVEEHTNKWRPPTPPRDPTHPPQATNLNHHRRSILSPPLSEPSISPKPKYDTMIRGYETWTMEDDKILMAHVLTRLSGGRWQEVSTKLRSKHSPELCEKRWEVLRDLLVRGADKSGTRGW
ncbi:uncharacterized protein B0P05DRAFT_546032 [Gilbertella persicaria]|uniref:uncharacterized protein n=1 Tax=Gilbertella persicaria TaxID=101096 RepID=UPI00221FD37F|nr:uncharacterized protein B0P05DRAFT_546032 [Gilbertella persicaria]KAI8076481.1 hypothetical protein B0P05DRAFT_546032 [Gilbertella persicaria]